MASVKAVVGTNVIVSGLLFGGEPARLLNLARDRSFQAVISLYILSELRTVLEEKSKLDAYLINELIEELIEFCEVTSTIESQSNWTSDAKDNPVVQTALESNSSYIVTGDKKFLASKTPVELVTVKQFLNIIMK